MILSGEWKVAKIVQFWAKSKAIHLVFWRILAKNHVDWFWVESEKWPKSCNFQQKVRLYTWYFGEFSAPLKIMWTWFWVESEKWPKYVQLYEQKVRLIHLVFWRILASTQNPWTWFWVESEKWPKYVQLYQQNLRLYTWYFGQFWLYTQNHVDMILSGEWKVAKIRAIVWAKSKAHTLGILANFDQKSCGLILSGEWKVAKIRAIFSKKYRLYTWYFGEFWPKSCGLILSGEWKVAKIVQFSAKSKAIHLVFWRISAKNHVDMILSGEWKVAKIRAIYEQKVRLIHLHVFWRIFTLHSKSCGHDFEWRVKSGQNTCNCMSKK